MLILVVVVVSGGRLTELVSIEVSLHFGEGSFQGLAVGAHFRLLDWVVADHEVHVGLEGNLTAGHGVAPLNAVVLGARNLRIVVWIELVSVGVLLVV